MKKNILLLFVISIITIFSCAEKSMYGQPKINVENIQKDFKEWWSYYYVHINLSSNFIAIDTLSKEISKADFLKILTTGKYIPAEITSKDSSKTYYKLFKINQTADKGIESVIKNASSGEYAHFKMEGQYFPTFNFTDLNGKQYTNENTKGKYVVLKCWFVKCHACVAEFPELNEMVNQYKNRNDIVFVSLALDDASKVEEFLLTKPFNYATVSDQKSLIVDILKIRAFPTHILIDKEGKIIKIVGNATKLKLYLAEAIKID